MASAPHLPCIAIDAMGGDDGVANMVAGVAAASARQSGFRYLLVGDAPQISDALAAHPALRAVATVRHAPEVISGEERPSQALRRAANTSLGLAIAAVKAGEAAAAVSAGNTGAMMAIAKLGLRTLPGIDRPALAAPLPTLGANDVVMLDLGANTECDARNLVQFAVMGAAYARIVTGRARPRLRLLNIGTEDIKGTDELRAAAAQLRLVADGLGIVFDGFIEADKLCRGEVDVVIADGFSGNVALKAVEGTARFVTDLLRRSFASSIRSRVGYAISRPATELLKHHLDPNNHNGGPFLGLNGIVVKSHGAADARGIANAVGVAGRLIAEQLITRIAGDIARLAPAAPDGGARAAAQ